MPSADAIERIMAASAAGMPTASSGGGLRQEPSVYWGRTQVSATRRAGAKGRMVGDFEVANPGAPRRTTSAVASLKSLSEAKGEFYRWNEEERTRWGQHLLNLGLIDEDEIHDYGALKGLWDDIVDESANFTTAGKQLTPWDVASLVAGGEKGAQARKAATAAKRPFSGTKSQTSRSVDLTDPKTAQALVEDVLSRQLGRAPTTEEVESFRGVLNSAERANPTTTTSSTTYRDGDAVSQSSTTSGGLSGAGKQQILMDQARALPEWGAYQASTTYADALFSAISAPV